MVLSKSLAYTDKCKLPNFENYKIKIDLISYSYLISEALSAGTEETILGRSPMSTTKPSVVSFNQEGRAGGSKLERKPF
jgi:hypothetical protein